MPRFKYPYVVVIVILVIALSSLAQGRLRFVPDNYESIQAAINDAGGGDTVIVRAGTYVENLNFNGQNLVLGSMFILNGNSSYIENTIIDGDSIGAVFTFDSGESPAAIVMGFTIQNGFYEDGAGVFCDGASPTIAYNIIKNNHARRTTGGGNGGGVYCGGTSTAIIMNNLIIRNYCDGVYGGFGGGVACRDADAILLNNTISQNLSNELGGGLFITLSNPIVTNTIIWNNEAIDDGNDIFVHLADPLITFCDIYAGYPGLGNINSNPEFRDTDNDNFRLMSTDYGYPYDSPCIDVGSLDVEDKVLDGDWGLGTALSDIGAYGGGLWVAVDIFEQINNIPDKITLDQNYPNPFNPQTTIDFTLDKPQHVSLKVYNLLGQEISSLIEATLEAGQHSVTYDGSKLSSGVYYYTLSTENRVVSRSMILMK